MRFIYYTDPGHGWIKVKKQFLKDYGIEDKISWYSYMRGDYAYLEEDCDYSLLIDVLINNKIPYTIINKNARIKSSKIRSYDHYKLEI